MKNKRTIIGLGAVIVFLLMASNATALNILQTESMLIKQKEVYVEPNIHVTLRQISVLKRAITQINDITIKELVQHIIDYIEEKGTATSNDIRQLISEGNYGIQAVHGLRVLNGQGPGISACIPFPILKSAYGILLLGIFYLIPTLMVWEVQYDQGGLTNVPGIPTRVTVGPYEYDRNNHEGGLSIGFIGCAHSAQIIQIPYDYVRFGFSGWSLLTFIKN